MDALLDGEVLVYRGRLHWGLFLGPALMDLLATAAAVALFVLKYPGAGILVFVAVSAWTLPALLRYQMNGLLLTNKRVIARTGIISRRSIDIALSKIEGVSFQQTLIGQMLNYGTIVIRGTGGGLEQFPKLAHPAEFSRQLHQQIGK